MVNPSISIKKYPHFDSNISVEAATKLVSDPKLVARHAFYPFIEYEKRWTRFAPKGNKGKEKSRLIRYAARRDACIFSFYRQILSELYESKLSKVDIRESVIGYRRIPSSSGRGNKCNIDFAHDAFSKIRELGNCWVCAIDISKFFENIDHSLLKDKWCELLDTKTLPPDHHQVFKAVTRFSCINKLVAYETLGLIGSNASTQSLGKKKGYLTKFDEVPTQLCTPLEFRQNLVPLITTNLNTHGIPQGAPISDLLSNIYMADFDIAMLGWVKNLGGFYFRYSDDILVVIPGSEDHWKPCMNEVQSLIKKTGDKLEIHPDKCSAYIFTDKDARSARQLCHPVQPCGCQNGIEYLGFRYDGRHIYIRENTRSRLNRKIAMTCRRVARSHVHHNPTMNLAQLRSTINANRVFLKVGRVRDFEDKDKSYKNWTFWTYAKRCRRILGFSGEPIYKQLAGYKRYIKNRLAGELESAFKRAQKLNSKQGTNSSASLTKP